MLTLAVTIGVLIPAWTTQVLHNDGVLVRVFSAQPATQVESPAFATFRALAPRQSADPQATTVSTGDDVDPLCPCVESPAELRAGRSAGATSTTQLVWSSDGRDAWELHNLHEQAWLSADRRLVGWRGGQRQVEFFTVSRNNSAP